ncbi:MAG: SMP-30/gluconolactonase/LRE family protein [Xenococcaceae cyanobacterium MO_188.B29]|nr:SMP-30/gluconolactonase/LRE family protein [Xenococcaceae cyanobacterium MO_188.B29]
MVTKLELIVESQALLGECPCWHQEQQLLYWVDGDKKQLHVYQAETKIDRTIQLKQSIGCVVPRKSGGVVLALEKGFAALDLETKKLTPLVNPESHPPSNRFNDGKCDPTGRFLAGTMAIKNQTQGVGALYSLDTNLTVRQLWSNLTVSNGIGWSPDYSTMYLIDSPTKKVFAFDYDLITGDISNRRVAVTIPDTDGYPDGMTTDTEGMIWVGLWAGYKVTRWNPNTGELLQTIPVPAPNVTSCTFGGANMNELYITTARTDMDRAQLDYYPKAGSVFRLVTDVIGMKNFEFGG